MAIFYEGRRIIKLNEQVCFGSAAFFYERVIKNGDYKTTV